MFSHPYCRMDVREGVKYRDAASLKRAVTYESKRAFFTGNTSPWEVDPTDE